MTDEKYYTPEISEFHEGFEYEAYVPDKDVWSNEVFYLNDSHIDLVLRGIKKIRCDIRVKYLDEEDILAEGWESLSQEWPIYIISNAVRPKPLDFMISAIEQRKRKSIVLLPGPAQSSRIGVIGEKEEIVLRDTKGQPSSKVSMKLAIYDRIRS